MTFTREETCRYISEQTSELAKLAVNADLGDLVYLLQMAQLEADNAVVSELKVPSEAA